MGDVDPSCVTCKFWLSNEPALFGICRRFRTKIQYPAYIITPYEHSIELPPKFMTVSEFFCAEWEENGS